MRAVESGTERAAGVARREGAHSKQRIGFGWLGFESIVIVVTAALWMRMRWEVAAGPHVPGFDPYLWPRALLILLGASASLLWLQRFRKAEVRRDGAAAAGLAAPVQGRVATFTALLLLYVQFMPAVGFSLSTLAFLGLTLRIVGGRGWRGTVAVGSSMTLALTVLFTTVFYLPLPLGVGVFRTISEAIQRLLLG